MPPEQMTLAIEDATESHMATSVDSLRHWFGVEFSIIDADTGALVYAGHDQPAADWDVRIELCRQVAHSTRAEVIAEENPLAVLAIPLPKTGDSYHVAVATFVSRVPHDMEGIDNAAGILGLTPRDARKWITRQPLWPLDALTRTAQLVYDRWVSERRTAAMQREVESLSVHLSETYEEISLLHRLAQKLKITSKDEHLAQMALEWLAEVLPVEAMAIQFLPAMGELVTPTKSRSEARLLSFGRCPVDNDQFTWLLERLGLDGRPRPLVVNLPVTQSPGWPFPAIRELVVVPLTEGDNLFGWLAAFNHSAGGEFGTDVASLVGSVAAILGIHSGNTDLYRQQAELLAAVVRALTSAIDAKDPYTCGHSDRVARVSVRLAQELGCDAEQLRVVYLSGLLHDIGKIGIDDLVLRKPYRLSDSEYEHIKSHTETGCRILTGLKHLDEVLPVVKHHHEQWDGTGYPSGLAGVDIPFLARVVAVADAFDAMSSDRPYRHGLSDEKLDAILRAGAGRQWDAMVVDAFFRVRDDVREIVRRDRQPAPVELQQWT